MTSEKCCILYNQPGENALADELDVLEQVEFIEGNLHELGIKTYRKGITPDFMKEVAGLAEEKPAFVFNLVESISNKGELCYFVPALLNMHSIPYTGNPVEAIFMTTSKALTKKLLIKNSIATPEGGPPSKHKLLTTGKKYILKPVWEDGSLGITAASVFTYDENKGKELEVYPDSHWLIEEYIDGREFNISVLPGPNGPGVLPAAEMIFHNYTDDMPKIVDFRAKWEEGTFEYENTRRDFPGDNLNRLLEERIKTAALNCWDVFGLNGYARVDMRVDKNDIPYVIEVNANPCLSPGSGLMSAVVKSGMKTTQAVEKIVKNLNI